MYMRITLYILQVSVSRTDCRLLHDSVFPAVSALAVATVIFTAGTVLPTLLLLIPYYYYWDGNYSISLLS